MQIQRRYEVYVLLDEERVIRYVGMTMNPEGRRKSHSHDLRFLDLTYETYEVCGEGESGKRAAEDLERNLIRFLEKEGLELLNTVHYGGARARDRKRREAERREMEERKRRMEEMRRIDEEMMRRSAERQARREEMFRKSEKERKKGWENPKKPKKRFYEDF